MSFRRWTPGPRTPPPAAEDREVRTMAEYTPGVSPIISQHHAYAMLSALKMVVWMMNRYGPGVLGTMEKMIRNAASDAEREANNQRGPPKIR